MKLVYNLYVYVSFCMLKLVSLAFFMVTPITFFVAAATPASTFMPALSGLFVLFGLLLLFVLLPMPRRLRIGAVVRGGAFGWFLGL